MSELQQTNLEKTLLAWCRQNTKVSNVPRAESKQVLNFNILFFLLLNWMVRINFMSVLMILIYWARITLKPAWNGSDKCSVAPVGSVVYLYEVSLGELRNVGLMIVMGRRVWFFQYFFLSVVDKITLNIKNNNILAKHKDKCLLYYLSQLFSDTLPGMIFRNTNSGIRKND